MELAQIEHILQGIEMQQNLIRRLLRNVAVRTSGDDRKFCSRMEESCPLTIEELERDFDYLSDEEFLKSDYAYTPDYVEKRKEEEGILPF